MSTNKNNPVAASFVQKLEKEGKVNFEPYIADKKDAYNKLNVVITELPDKAIGKLFYVDGSKKIDIQKNKAYSADKIMYDAHNKGEQREVKFEYYVMDSDRLKSEIKTVTINEFDQKEVDESSDLIGTEYGDILIADAYKGYKVWGAGGDDILIGNKGTNIFIINNSANTINETITEIRNFDLEDKIDLSQLICVQSIGDLKIDSKSSSTQITFVNDMYPQKILINDTIPNNVIENADKLFIYSSEKENIKEMCAPKEESLLETIVNTRDLGSFISGGMWGISFGFSASCLLMRIYNCICGKYMKTEEMTVPDTARSNISNISQLTHTNFEPIGITFEENKEIELIDLKDSNTKFVYNSVLSKTSWVGKNDGILFYDYNGSKVVDDKKIVITSWSKDAKTDFQALLQAFDDNKDNVFDKKDKKFGEFYIWQDKNSNGIVDEAELKSLNEHGIKAINFNESISANDEQLEQGILNVTNVEWEDGKITKAYDLVFQAEEVIM